MDIEKKDKKRFVRYLPYILAMLVLVFRFAGCGSQQQGQEEQQEVHVAVSGSDEAGTGTPDAPYATVSAAAEAAPEAIIVVHEGEYGPIKLGPECSGSENVPTVIRPTEGEKVVIHGEVGIGISLVNVSHIAVEGLEVEGGTRGIYYESTRKSGGSPEDICIKDCTVHGVRGTHGICVYDRNDLGFTEECVFEHNTLVDNTAQIGVQRSRDNRISANLIVGGETAVEFSEDCRKRDMINDISGNAFCGIEDEESWTVEYGKMYESRTEVIDGFRSLIDGTGSGFIPDEDLMELYNAQKRS